LKFVEGLTGALKKKKAKQEEEKKNLPPETRTYFMAKRLKTNISERERQKKSESLRN
jgi:hypothetical protein